MFTKIYELFISFFGNNLADYLYGAICNEYGEKTFEGSNQYKMYGFIALGIAFVVMIAYYYVINHPRFNRLISWLMMLLLVAVSNLIIGAVMTLGDLSTGNIGACLLSGESGGIYASDCWMFGLANFFVSAIFFIVFSFIFKWWSTNCKRVPF